MELKKTTILSAFVVITGILVEIIFRDTFSKSFAGVALSIVLALVVLVSFYFVIDGACCLESLHREEERKQQREYEQRVYSVLNEQLKFQKAVYSEVKNLQQQLTEQQMEIREFQINPMSLSEQPAGLQQMPEVSNITTQDLEQLASEINDHTMQAAKIVAKYVGKSTEELKEEIRSDK